MNVSACLVTDGKHDMSPVFDSLPVEWEIVTWDNGRKVIRKTHTMEWEMPKVPDLSVYGRYAAIEYATHDLIYVQDDDVIVSDPQAIVDALIWENNMRRFLDPPQEVVVCNLPQEFRPHYPDSALVGFGACFHRDAPERAFARFHGTDTGYLITRDLRAFNCECDRVFTCLTPRVLVDIPKQDREFASDPDRLWKQPGHGESTRRMLDLARQVRDA